MESKLTFNLRSKFAVLCIISTFLSSCSSEQEILEAAPEIEPPVAEETPPLEALGDDFTELWSESVVLDILQNDQYEHSVEIEIVEPPAYGSIEINENQIIYLPSHKKKTVDTFKYKLIGQEAESNVSDVSLQLINGITSVTSSSDTITSGKDHQIIIETLLPASNDRVMLERTLAGEFIESQLFSLQDNSLVHSLNFNLKREASDALGLTSPLNYKIEVVYFSDKLALELDFYVMPTLDKLHQSLRPLWYNAQEANRVLDSKLLALTWTSFAPWTIPDSKTWNENPYSSLTWQLYYHSLAWLHAAEFRSDQGIDIENNLTYIKSVVFDYLDKAAKDKAINYMSWNDHTVAWRAEVLSYLYLKYFQGKLSAEEDAKFSSFIDDHFDTLNELLDDERFFAHNHSMYHAIALYNMSFVFIETGLKYDAQNRALQRIEELFDEMVNAQTGMSVEQSFNYHLVAMELFANAIKNINDLSATQYPRLEAVLRKMLDFALHFVFENGKAPAFGDTNFDARSYLPKIIEIAEVANVSSDYLEYHTGSNGRPLEQVYAETDDGFSILRKPSTHTFVTFGKQLFSHGHHDIASVTFANNSNEILIDSGGPYQYDRAEREYFRSPYAHNTLVVNGQRAFTNDGRLIESRCQESLCYAIGQKHETDHLHTRVVINDDKESLLVFDFIDSSNENMYELVYNLHPDLEHAPTDASDSLQLSIGEDYVLEVESTNTLELDAYRGYQGDDFIQGWVQPKFGTRTPTTSLIYNSSATNFAALTKLIKANMADAISMQVDDDIATISVGDRKVVISSLRSESPQIEIF